MTLSDRIRSDLRKMGCDCAAGTQLNETPTSMASKDKLKDLDNGEVSDPKALKTEPYTFRGGDVDPKKKDFKTPMDVNKKTAAQKDIALRIICGLNKESGRYSDFLGNATTSLIPYAGGLASTAGEITGAIAGAPSDKDLKDRGSGKSWIPGVGAYRMNSLIKKDIIDSGKRGGRDVSALHTTLGLGALGNTALAALIGAAIGASIQGARGEDVIEGGLAGAGIGGAAGLASQGIGVLSAAATPTWTDEKAEKSATTPLKQYLLPGVAGYRRFKHLGHGYKKYQNQ